MQKILDNNFYLTIDAKVTVVSFWYATLRYILKHMYTPQIKLNQYKAQKCQAPDNIPLIKMNLHCSVLIYIHTQFEQGVNQNKNILPRTRLYQKKRKRKRMQTSFWNNLHQEEIKDTKGLIQICKSKTNRQHNGQKKRDKMTTNDLQNIHIKLKIE